MKGPNALSDGAFSLLAGPKPGDDTGPFRAECAYSENIKTVDRGAAFSRRLHALRLDREKPDIMRQSSTRHEQTRAGFTLVEIMITVLIIGILLAIALPTWLSARDTSRTKACIENLNHIDTAKNQYIMDNNLGTFTNESDVENGPEPLVPTYLRAVPVCPAGGTYQTGDFTTLPTCSLAAEGHSLT